MYGKALKQIHSVKTHGCPIKINDDAILEGIKHRIDEGMILDDPEEEHKNLIPRGTIQQTNIYNFVIHRYPSYFSGSVLNGSSLLIKLSITATIN